MGSSEHDGWFDERICKCERFHYELDYNWAREFDSMLRPPTCKACGKWADRLQLCVRCSQNYYQFFWHPCMGWEPSLSIRGWECWDCLNNFNRAVTTPVNCERVPPPDCVVNPHHVILLPPQLSAESQKVFDDFDSILDSI